MDCLTGEIIDPFKGLEDIEKKILRATSEHFPDDPMRALRLAGQSARFDFTIQPETLMMARAVVDELKDEPKERMLIELTKVLDEAPSPGTFFQVLEEAGLLRVTFREIAELSKEMFTKMIIYLNGVAQLSKNPKVRFATLGLILGEENLLNWDKNMKLPGDWLDSALTVSKFASLLEVLSPENIVMVINSLRRGALSVEEFDLIIQGAGVKLPLLSPFKVAMSSTPQVDRPKDLKGKEIGEWLKKKHIERIGQLL